MSTVPHGFVFYPRAYHIDDANPDSSFVDGIDESGVERRVYLNPDERARQAARKGTAETVPLLSRFAEEGRRAKNPCFASPDNGPANPGGVMLVEQATARDDGAVNARWASILSESADTPPPVVGVGGLEINFHPSPDENAAGLIAQYRQLMRRDDVDAVQERAQLHNAIIEARLMWAVAAILRPEETITLGSERNVDVIREAASPFLEKYTKGGLYGGVWLRVRSGNVVDPEASQMVNRQYDYKAGQVQTLDQLWANFFRFNSGKLLAGLRRGDAEIDIMPMERINAGKAGNDKFKEGWMALRDGGVPKLQKLYTDRTNYLNPLVDPVKANSQLVARVAVRLAKIYSGYSKGNCLVSTIHAYSRPVGHPLQVGKDGTQTFEIKGRQVRRPSAAEAEPAL